MAFHNPFKRHDKQAKQANTDERQDAQKHAPAITTTDVKDLQTSSQHPAQPDGQSLPPAYGKQSQAHPPDYRTLAPDPHDPDGPSYGYQYVENEQNFPHPSSVSKDIGKEMKYDDPKAADIARRASQAGREDLTEMMNYHLRQQELGKKSTDNTIAAWNGV